MIRAAIIGATGYTGVELMRLLAGHPGVELAAVTSRSEAGRPVTEVFPSLRGVTALAYTDPDTEALADCDVVFFATPNGTAMKTAPALLERGVKVMNLSADFRLRDAREWEHWYGMQHACPELLAEAIYGLPEMNRQRLCGARLVANPGCYPTAVQLGFLPLLEAGLVDPASLVADAKSGVSGAGRKASIPHLYAEASESFTAYGVSGHRHLPEIVQGLNSVSTGQVGLVFVPHLVPMIRGIHATLYARLTDTAIDLTALYSERYRDEPFVDVLPAGSHVNTASVRGTNLCRIACHRPGNGATAVILAVEDNLVKGAAGQAIQNLNIMFGLDEQAGLDLVACCP